MTEGKAEYKEHEKQPTASRHVGASIVVPKPPSDECANIYFCGVGVGELLSRETDPFQKTEDIWEIRGRG